MLYIAMHHKQLLLCSINVVLLMHNYSCAYLISLESYAVGIKFNAYINGAMPQDINN